MSYLMPSIRPKNRLTSEAFIEHGCPLGGERLGPDMRMAVVAASSHFATRPPPKMPQDLTGHSCINLRLPTHGGKYASEFERGKRKLNVRVDGQLVFSSSNFVRDLLESRRKHV